MYTIIASIIGLIGIILGALIKAFEDDLKTIFLGRNKQNQDLIGKWKCTWFVEDEIKGEKRLTADMVVISKISGNKVIAKGENLQAGGYSLTGRISPAFVMTLIYHGDETADHVLGGVTILELNLTRNELHGYWHEFAADRQFYGGRTVWKKV